MLRIVTWRWKPPEGYRSKFGPETVNILASMIERHYPKRHQVICVTDDPAGIDGSIKVLPIGDLYANLPSPHGHGQPSCYRRLRMFSADAKKEFGPRFVSIDLDVIITGDLRPVWDRPEDFVMWGNTNPQTTYNGSMVMMRAGARRQVWEDFDPASSPAMAKAAGQFGSDQAWISYKLGPGEARWGKEDGVLSYRNDILPRGGGLPHSARVVFFHGRFDPWSPEVYRRHQWVRDNWR